MKDREPRRFSRRKLLTNTIRIFSIVGGGALAYDGITRHNNTVDKEQRIHTRPDPQELRDAKTIKTYTDAMANLKMSQGENVSEDVATLNSQAKNIIQRENNYQEAIDKNSNFQFAKYEVIGSLSAVVGLATAKYIDDHARDNSNRNALRTFPTR